MKKHFKSSILVTVYCAVAALLTFVLLRPAESPHVSFAGPLLSSEQPPRLAQPEPFRIVLPPSQSRLVIREPERMHDPLLDLRFKERSVALIDTRELPPLDLHLDP